MLFLQKISELLIPINQNRYNNCLAAGFFLYKQKNHAIEMYQSKVRTGELTKESYVHYIIDLYEVYTSLEICIQKIWENKPNFENQSESHYESFFRFLNNPLLFRSEKLLKDLCSCDLSTIRLTPCSQIAREYADYLLSLSTYHPDLLIAHAYVRYIEDLSVAEVMQQWLSNKWPTATLFCDFSELLLMTNQTNQEFQNDFKSRLNTINFTDKQIADLMSECIVAYNFYLKLLEQAVLI